MGEWGRPRISTTLIRKRRIRSWNHAAASNRAAIIHFGQENLLNEFTRLSHPLAGLAHGADRGIIEIDGCPDPNNGRSDLHPRMDRAGCGMAPDPTAPRPRRCGRLSGSVHSRLTAPAPRLPARRHPRANRALLFQRVQMNGRARSAIGDSRWSGISHATA